MMQKKFLFIGAVPAALAIMSFNCAFAQSLTTADPSALPSTESSTLTDPATPFSPEAPPADADTGVSSSSATGSSPENTDTASATGTAGGANGTSASLNLPTPVLPVLDLGLAEDTDEDSGLLLGNANDLCLTAENAEAQILPPVIGNQIKIALMVFLGALLGAMLWILGAGIVGSARGRAELLRLRHDEREKRETRLTETLAETKAALAEALNGLAAQQGARSAIDPAGFERYRRAAADLELLGSEESLQAHRQLTALLSQPKPPSPEELGTAKSYLLQSLQSDIMGDIGQTAPSAS